jgi:hypothetical protein
MHATQMSSPLGTASVQNGPQSSAHAEQAHLRSASSAAASSLHTSGPSNGCRKASAHVAHGPASPPELDDVLVADEDETESEGGLPPAPGWVGSSLHAARSKR